MFTHDQVDGWHGMPARKQECEWQNSPSLKGETVSAQSTMRTTAYRFRVQTGITKVLQALESVTYALRGIAAEED
jgi:hypothetical protein